MTVISSKEFMSNEKKYFDLAMTEEIFVKRDNIMFIVSRVNDIKPKKCLKPDDDLHRAITMDELLGKVLDDIDKYYDSK